MPASKSTARDPNNQFQPSVHITRKSKNGPTSRGTQCQCRPCLFEPLSQGVSEVFTNLGTGFPTTGSAEVHFVLPATTVFGTVVELLCPSSPFILRRMSYLDYLQFKILLSQVYFYLWNVAETMQLRSGRGRRRNQQN